MTSLERVCAVIEGRIPDRVPACLLSFQNAARMIGRSIGDYCVHGDIIAEAQLAYWEEFRHDMIQIENGIAALAEAVGCRVEYVDEKPPWVTRPAIEDLSQVGRLRDIEPGTTPAIAALLRATRVLAGELGDRVCIRGDCDQGPFSLASQILGPDRFLMALMDPEKAGDLHRLLEYATRQVAALARAQFAAGSHYSMIGDSIAGPDVCSPPLYRSFAAPYERSLVRLLRAEGHEVGNHICGNATAIIKDMLGTETSYFELDFKIDREAVRAATRGKATIIGTVDPSNLLPRGTPSEVAAKSREDLLIMGQGGRFILGAGCTIPRDTPAENVHALVDAALECGWYDERGNLSPHY